MHGGASGGAWHLTHVCLRTAAGEVMNGLRHAEDGWYCISLDWNKEQGKRQLTWSVTHVNEVDQGFV